MLPSPDFRMTRQRSVILEELRAVTSHPTADQMYEQVRRRLPRVSLGTVYRNLDLLTEQGVIQKLELAGTQRRFDGNVQNHYHLRCVRCGRVEDAPIAPFGWIEQEVQQVTAYEIIGHRLKFLGLCPQCRQIGPTGPHA